MSTFTPLLLSHKWNLETRKKKTFYDIASKEHLVPRQRAGRTAEQRGSLLLGQNTYRMDRSFASSS